MNFINISRLSAVCLFALTVFEAKAANVTVTPAFVNTSSGQVSRLSTVTVELTNADTYATFLTKVREATASRITASLALTVGVDQAGIDPSTITSETDYNTLKERLLQGNTPLIADYYPGGTSVKLR